MWLLVLFLAVCPAMAHEVRPVYLAIRETSGPFRRDLAGSGHQRHGPTGVTQVLGRLRGQWGPSARQR